MREWFINGTSLLQAVLYSTTLAARHKYSCLQARTRKRPLLQIEVELISPVLLAYALAQYREKSWRTYQFCSPVISRPSRANGEMGKVNPMFIQSIDAALQGRLIPSPGGSLIKNKQEKIIDSIGASGDRPSENAF